MKSSPCDEALLLFSDLLAGEISPEEAGSVETHLASCPSCRELAAGYGRLDRALAELVAQDKVPGWLDHIRAAAAHEVQLPAPAAESLGLSVPSSPSTKRRPLRTVFPASRRAWLLAGAAAAAVLLAFFSGLYLSPGPARASSEALVRAAQQTHALLVDRQYLVQIRLEWDDLARGLPLVRPRETRLHTRGDRFWIASANPDETWAWGRDDQGRVWVARSRKEGVRFEVDEADLPRPLALNSAVYSLKMETLLTDVLADFDLRREPPEAAETVGCEVVRAELKPGRDHPSLRAALLEIDAESKVLRRIVLWRLWNPKWGRPGATVTFTLVGSEFQDDSRYRLEGHLDEDATVYSRTHEPQQRLHKLPGPFGGMPQLPPGLRKTPPG